MGLIEIGIFLIFLTLLFLIVFLILRKPPETVSEDAINLLLKERLLDFQTEMHKELNSTRQEISQSKDLISKHTIKTLETMKNMGETIHKITQQQEEAQRFGQSLKDLLQAPKLRGNYGEAVLEEMLDRVLPKQIWESQYTIDDQKQVDAVIKMKGIIIPIDAKFPRDNYQRYLDAETAAAKEQHWKAYEADVKKQIKEISGKYIKPEAGTSDFALMFIPSEAVYYETIAEKNYIGKPSRLYEIAQAHHVIPVSPNTFYAFLQVIVIGIRNQEIIQSAAKLQEGLAAVQRSFDYFYQQYNNMGSQIEKAAKSFRLGDDHIRRYKDRLDTTLQAEAFHQSGPSLPGAEAEKEKSSDNPPGQDKTHR
jgi:DNA recombination protein RmuC